MQLPNTIQQSNVLPNTIQQRTGQTPVKCVVSVIKQNEGDIKKSITDAREIPGNLSGMDFPSFGEVQYRESNINPSLRKGFKTPSPGKGPLGGFPPPRGVTDKIFL